MKRDNIEFVEWAARLLRTLRVESAMYAHSDLNDRQRMFVDNVHGILNDAADRITVEVEELD